jgi:hypothetical protein
MNEPTKAENPPSNRGNLTGPESVPRKESHTIRAAQALSA